MRLLALETAFPGRPWTQADVLALLREADVFRALGRRGQRVLETVLQGDSGIHTRHFAIPPQRVFELDAEGLAREFENQAPALGTEALKRALRAAGLEPRRLDLLVVATCTGYLCPGLSSYVAERAGLRADCELWDLAGMGCAAAVPAMRATQGFLQMHPGAVAATLAVEVCSAAFDLCEETGTLVSACLFGDGAAAALWAEDNGPGWHADHFQTRTYPSYRELIRLINARGRLRNKLERQVPEAAAAAVAELFPLRTAEPDAVIVHPGGRDVIEAVAKVVPGHSLSETREAFRRFGNLSSPSVLVAAKLRLERSSPGRKLWLAGFGAGFSISCCEWTQKTGARDCQN